MTIQRERRKNLQEISTLLLLSPITSSLPSSCTHTHSPQLANKCSLIISGSKGFNHFPNESGKIWSFVSSIYDSQGVKKTYTLQIRAIVFPDRNPFVCIFCLEVKLVTSIHPRNQNPLVRSYHPATHGFQLFLRDIYQPFFCGHRGKVIVF